MTTSSFSDASADTTAPFGTWVLRALSVFIPNQDLDRIELIRQRLFVAVSLLVALNTAMFAALHHLHHVPGTSYLVVEALVVICVLSLIFPFFLRAGVQFQFLVTVFMLFFQVSIFAIAWTDGGLNSGAIFWIAVVPLAAACIGGARLGMIVAFMSAGSGLILFTAGVSGHEFVQSLSAEDASKHYIINYAFAAILVGVLSALYEGPIVRQLRIEIKALGEAQNAAEAASRSKSSLLANMSHEFRTPLTAVLSGAEILRDEANDDDKPILESMERGARRLMATLEGVIDLSRIDGNHSMNAKPTDILPLVRNVAWPYAASAIKKGVAFEVRGDSTLSVVDSAVFCRVFSALIDNAVRFTEAGAVVVTLGAEAGRAVLTVTDTGVGMAQEFAARAPEPFLQASDGHGRTHEGLGLGLTLAHRMTEAMGGQLVIETAPGMGTSVRVEFPMPVSSRASLFGADLEDGPPPRVRRGSHSAAIAAVA